MYRSIGPIVDTPSAGFRLRDPASPKQGLSRFLSPSQAELARRACRQGGAGEQVAHPAHEILSSVGGAPDVFGVIAFPLPTGRHRYGLVLRLQFGEAGGDQFLDEILGEGVVDGESECALRGVVAGEVVGELAEYRAAVG